MADDDEMKSYVDSFVKKDMKDHPDCRYSLSSQKECSSNNGSFACETIRRVFRNCPGLRPEQVYDITTRDSGNIPKSPGGSSGGGGGGGGGVSVPGAKAPQQPRGGSPAFGPQDIWPPGRSGMDDLLGNLHDRLNSFFKESPFAVPDADINPFGGGGGGGGSGGEGGGGGGSVSVGDQSGGAEFPPRVPPPHKRRQSDAANEEQGAGEAANGGSSVARA